MKDKKQFALIIAMLFLSIFFLAGGVYNIFKGFHNFKWLNFSYQEDNSVHYKVFLKENDFFETPYLDENKTYITSLIDHLNIDFQYLINFSEEVSGNYEYVIKAIISADKADNAVGNYWTKEFVVKELSKLDVKDKKEYLIKENIDIDYNQYNDLLNEFKKATQVTTDAKLTIKMEVKNDVGTEDAKVKNSRNLSFSIPLSELTVEGKADTESENGSNTISKQIRDNNPKFIFCRVVGIISTLTSFVMAFSIYKLYRRMILKDIYKHKLKKIITTYDGVIVNVKNMPDLSNYNVIMVTSFEELIDAHSEVRMPINFYESTRKKESFFVLINGSQAYVYRFNLREAANETQEDED
jgi:hypothetical protein